MAPGAFNYREIFMKTPFININLKKLEHNLAVIRQLCLDCHLDLTPVSKVVMGHPTIAQLFQRYSHSIGDSRICDLRRMVTHGIKGPFMLIRTPALSEVDEVAELAQISMQSDLSVAKALHWQAMEKKINHQIIIMIEMGDLREGILMENFSDFLNTVASLKGLEVLGFGTNATCFAGLIPTPENLSFLYQAQRIFKKCFAKEPLVSGGGSNLIPLMLNQSLPDVINHVRIGEAIVMGVDAIKSHAIPNCHQDCFTLYGEIIEIAVKPSGISGLTAHNAFGENMHLKDRGKRKRALLNIGRLDTDIHHIRPLRHGVEILGASSDHLVLDVEEAGNLQTGDILGFSLNYASLLFAMNSDYVIKNFI